MLSTSLLHFWAAPFYQLALFYSGLSLQRLHPTEGPRQPICHGSTCELRSLNTATEMLSFEICVAPQWSMTPSYWQIFIFTPYCRSKSITTVLQPGKRGVAKLCLVQHYTGGWQQSWGHNPSPLNCGPSVFPSDSDVELSARLGYQRQDFPCGVLRDPCQARCKPVSVAQVYYPIPCTPLLSWGWDVAI